MKKVKVIIEKTSTGYSAYADKYPVFSTGADIMEMRSNIVEAINFYFDETGQHLIVQKKDLDIKFSIPSLFELYPINVRHFAKRIGMNYTLLAQYVQGRKKPSTTQAEKIVDGLNVMGRELSEVEFI